MTDIDPARETELVRKWLEAREGCNDAKNSGSSEEHLKALAEHGEAGLFWEEAR